MPNQVTGNILTSLSSTSIILYDASTVAFGTAAYHTALNASFPIVNRHYVFNKATYTLGMGSIIATKLNNSLNSYAVTMLCEDASNVFKPAQFSNALLQLKLWLDKSFTNTYTTGLLSYPYTSSVVNYGLVDIRVPNGFGVARGASFTQVKSILDSALGATGSTVYV
jgi:hypothetical protein